MPSVSRATRRHARRDEERRRGRLALAALAESAGVELLFDAEEAAKHGLEPSDDANPDIAVVLGGDGTMLRALARFLDSGVPVVGANFGRVGFLATIPGDELESGLGRVFAGDYAVLSLPTLEVELDGQPARRRQRRRRRQRHTGPDHRDRLLDRRRGSRHAAVRRADLRDPVRLDRVQPLERRPGARVGPRRRRGHLRRAAHAARAAARRRAGPRARRLEPDAGRGRGRARRRPPCRLARPQRGGVGALRLEPHPTRNLARSRRSSAATARSSASRLTEARTAWPAAGEPSQSWHERPTSPLVRVFPRAAGGSAPTLGGGCGRGRGFGRVPLSPGRKRRSLRSGGRRTMAGCSAGCASRTSS